MVLWNLTHHLTEQAGSDALHAIDFSVLTELVPLKIRRVIKRWIVKATENYSYVNNMEALHLSTLKLSFHLLRSSPTFFKPRNVEGVFIGVASVSFSEADINSN